MARDFAATARHIGEDTQRTFEGFGARPDGDKQPYGTRLYDPRLNLDWEVLEEYPFQPEGGDISIQRVGSPNDSTESVLTWSESWVEPILRMYPLQEGEALNIKGFPLERIKLEQQSVGTSVVGEGIVAWGCWNATHFVDTHRYRLLGDKDAANWSGLL